MSSAGLPWFKFYASDYLLDESVDMLAVEAQGILVRLWCLCWRSGALPDVPDTLALRTKVDPKIMRKHWPVLRPFFTEGEDGLVSERMEKERFESKSLTESRRLGAQKTNAKRWNTPIAERVAERLPERVADVSVSESDTESDKNIPPKPPKAAKGKKVVLGEYPSQMEEAIKAYRTLMKDCKSPEVMNRFPEDKRFIASGIGPNEGIWKAWKNRLGSIVHGSPVTDADILAAIQRIIQARGHDATKGIRLAIPMLPTLINSDYFVDALVKVKEVSNAS